MLLFIECHSWSLLALSQMFHKAKYAFVCVRKRELESEWYTEAKKGIKVFVHKRVGIIEAERRIVQFEVILHLCPHLILNLFFSAFFLPQDEKNQVLITNAWLQLVSFYLVSFCTRAL